MNSIMNNVFSNGKEQIAANRLVKAQKCKTVQDQEYNIPVYGQDLNGLDGSRKWLFDENIASGKDYEMARIEANKLILYVRESDLREEMKSIA